jgi:hypothetical protein
LRLAELRSARRRPLLPSLCVFSPLSAAAATPEFLPRIAAAALSPREAPTTDTEQSKFSTHPKPKPFSIAPGIWTTPTHRPHSTSARRLGDRSDPQSDANASGECGEPTTDRASVGIFAYSFRLHFAKLPSIRHQTRASNTIKILTHHLRL